MSDPAMKRNGLKVGANATVLVVSLTLIFSPELRELAAVRWMFIALFMTVMGFQVLSEFRAGHLTVPLSQLPRRKLDTSAVSLLAAVIGTIALVLVL